MFMQLNPPLNYKMTVTIVDDWRYSLSYSLVFLFKTMLPLGSVIPFLAAEQGISQTQFSSILVLKSIGNIIGALLFTLLKSAQLVPPSHVICTVGIISQMVFMSIFLLGENMQLMGLSIFLSSLAAKVTMITVNVCMVMTLSNERKQTWLPLSHSMFSAGSVLGPLWVRLAGKQALFWVMGFQAPTLLFYFFFPSPNLEKPGADKAHEAQQAQQYASNTNMWLMAGSLSLLLGIESFIGAWVNTYAVQSGVSTKEQATIYPSTFWILATVSRFFIAAISVKLSHKLFFFILAQFVAGLLCSILAFAHHPESALLLAVCLFGIFLSPLYPLILSVSKDSNINYSSDQMATIMVITSLSDIFFAPIVGLCMKFDVNFFFYCFNILGGLMLLTCLVYCYMLREQSDMTNSTRMELQNQEQIQCQ